MKLSRVQMQLGREPVTVSVLVQPRLRGPGRPSQKHQVSRHAVLARAAQRARQGTEN